MSAEDDILTSLLVLARSIESGKGYRVFHFEDQSNSGSERFCLVIGKGETARRMSEVAHLRKVNGTAIGGSK